MNNTEVGTPRIKIPQGILDGFVLTSRRKQQYYGFYGIPYATVLERFELPRRWERWNGIREGTRARDRCIQQSKVTKRFMGSEKCHYLNVFSPKFTLLDIDQVRDHPPTKPPEKFPYSSMVEGTILERGIYMYGNKFLSDEFICLVTLNYRLGALGFLNTGDGTVPGNLAMHDQVMALQWVKENIGFFGGDAENVTLMGESAGAACVHFHLLSPLSTGLFSKAIMQSGSALCPWAFNYNPVEKFKKLLKQLDLNGGFHNTTEAVTKLKRLEPQALIAQRKDYDVWKEDAPIVHFAPSIESGPKKFLTDSPIQLLYTGKLVNEVPLIIGVNAHEALYRSLPILKDPNKLTKFNKCFSSELPTHLMYKKEGVPQHEDFAKRIRKFYFDNKPILSSVSVDGRQRLTRMISDRLFYYPTRKTALIHRSLIKDPANKIYLYYFDYTGRYSLCNGFEVSDTYGACHADELQYLMNQQIFYSKICAGSEADQIIDKMTAMWGSFARSGVPSYPKQTEPWLPMPHKEEIKDDSLEYFSIDLKDETILEPFKDRMEFWDHIPNLSLVF